MRTITATPLSERTTLRLGGPAARLVEAGTDDDLVSAVAVADTAGEPLLVLGGGSNLVVADDGFPGTVVAVSTRGMVADADRHHGVTVRVAAGENWDELVAAAVDGGWTGIEALSGIPGRVGAVPIQNVGAYGQEVADTIVSVHLWDRWHRMRRSLPASACGFGYRSSRFKADPHRFVVLEVTFRFGLGGLGEPVRYAELAAALGVDVGARVPAREVREAVLALRRSKGMVLDEADHDTWSVGSFFTNPVLAADDAARLPAPAPRWPQPDGRVKTSAAWLIGAAGYSRGYARGRVALSTKHTLALTNRGGATTAELLALAREIRDTVRQRFGVTLVNEPVIVGADL
ncbi:MAG: UDP-N-acetylmuramate dehydrogenase [Actinomycetota bacterium]|nr:UDP-N-acetylmuramate dehydrogenase [Actinomycetota bacterium]